MQVVVDIITQLGNVLLGKVLDTDVRIHAGGRKDLLSGFAAYTKDIGQTDLDPLFSRQVNASYTSHTSVTPPLFGFTLSPDAVCAWGLRR